MRNESLKRRDFHKLTVAAFGGMLAGSGGSALAAEEEQEPKVDVEPALLLKEPHTCRGINSCKTKGAGANNACAGQGACAAVKAHACNGQNECKGQGGCGGYPGQNSCKGKGHCAVPLSEATWKIARKQFEHLMKDGGKKFGDAPAAKK
ncbi:MAG: hypothetical protein WED34_08810 [Planctomycetales bacterium]